MVATSTQNLMHSNFSLGYQVELGGEAENSNRNNDDSDESSVTFTEWLQPGDSENDHDDMSDNFPDSTVCDQRPDKTLKKKGLVPYVGSDSEDFTSQETAAKQKVDTPPVPAQTASRFKSASTSDDLKKLSGKTFADSTDKKISWAVKLYMSWRRSRIEADTAQGDIEGANLYDKCVDPGQLGCSLCCFLNEVCCADGKEYPGNTLYSLLVMIQLHLEKQGKDWKLMEGSNFLCVRNTLDNLMKQRALACISKAAKSADPISIDDEQKLWDEGVLGEFQPDQLRSTVMYLLGLTFALRGCQEQRALRCPPHDPQITVHVDTEGNEYLLYKEDVHSKINQGGLKNRKNMPKQVKAYGHSDFYCNIVRLYKKYCSVSISVKPAYKIC